MTAPQAAERAPVPADGLLHAVPLLGIALLAVNDHWLKGAVGGWWTGKLSDVAGMLFFPLLLQAMVEVVLAATRRSWGPSRSVLVVACLASGAGLAAINLWPAAADAWSQALGALQWPFRAAWRLAAGDAVPGVAAVRTVADPTDLLAVPAVVAAGWAGWRRGAVSRVNA